MSAIHCDHTPRSLWQSGILAAALLSFCLVHLEVMAQGKTLPGKMQEAANNQDMYSTPAVIGPTMTLLSGKSTLLRLDAPIDRVSVGNPAVADVTIISPRELYLLGKNFGSTNVILWRKGGQTTAIDLVINIDAGILQDKLSQLLPGE